MTKKAVEFTINKEALRGTFFKPKGKGSFPVVIFDHGRGSSRKRYLPIAERLANEEIMTLAFDFRGCGESDGVFEEQSYQNGIEDAGAAIEFILKQNIDQNRLGLCGSSFGAYALGMILPKYPFMKSVLLRSPAAYSDKFISATGYQEVVFFAKKKNWRDASVYKNIENFKGAVLVLKCENDGLLPDELVEKYYKVAVNAKKRELDILRGADHTLSDPVFLDAFYNKTYNWFIKTL